MRHCLSLMVLCIALLLTPAYAAELVEPPPIAVPQLAPELVEKAIRIAAAERRWTVAAQEPGVLVADLAHRSHLARVRIKYDASQVSLTYLDSLNLDYEEDGGARTIHRSYNNWVGALADAIGRALQRSDLASAELPPDPSAPPPANPLAPPPAERFNNFAQIELAPLVLAPEFRDEGVNQRAADAIERKLRARLEPRIAQWNAVDPAGGRSLRIEPRIEDIRLIPGAARAISRLPLGDSALTVRVRYVEPASGRVIAEPIFRGGREAQEGERGAIDSGMLEHVAHSIAQYTIDHYALREPTGLPEGPARILQATDTVAVTTGYGDGVGTQPLRAECTWLDTLPDHIARFSKAKVVRADPAGPRADLELAITVAGVHASGGGAWGGVKYARLQGELRDRGFLVGSFEAQRQTKGGGFTACAAIEALGEVMGKEIAAWLQRPVLNARLGDLRKR